MGPRRYILRPCECLQVHCLSMIYSSCYQRSWTNWQASNLKTASLKDFPTLKVCSISHLIATELSRWDNLIGEKASITTNHIPVSPIKSGAAAAKAFINQLAQSLINGGYISSKGDILDAGSTPEWVEIFSYLPEKPCRRGSCSQWPYGR
jgi:hypothetical protein